MIRIHLKMIFRNFFADGLYTTIIVLGLAVGIAVSLMIAQYVHFEFSFDKQFKDNDRIFYTYMNWIDRNGSGDYLCHPAIGPFIKRSVPEIEEAVRIIPAGLNAGDEWVLRRERQGTIQEYSRTNHMYLADPEILDFFSITMVAGDPHTALRDPESIVISRSVADKFFPNESPMGQTLHFFLFEFKVAGVMEDLPPNSSLQSNVFFSMNVINTFQGEGYLEANWIWSNFQTFIKIQPDANYQAVEKKINVSARDQLAHLKKEYDIDQSIRLFPFADFHFYRPYNSAGVSPVEFTGDKRILKFFAAIGVLILIISWANYVNLTIARSLRRAKEVGLRKVSGAGRTNLIVQFLWEFFFLNAVSLMVAFTITQLAFNIFASAIGSKAEWMLWKEPWFWLAIVLFLFISTLASGVYPAFVMSNYNPVKVLKGNFSRSQSGTKLRRALVLMQFGLSAFLLMSIYVISRQLIYMQTKDLGISVEQILVVRLYDLDTAINKDVAFDRLKAKIQNRDDIVSAAAISNYPGDKEPRSQQYSLSDDTDKKSFLEVTTITEDYINTMGLSLLHGRTFSDDKVSDSTRIIINETAARQFGFENPESALGHELIFTISKTKYEIIGIVKDFSTSIKDPGHGSIFHHRKAPHSQTTYFVLRLSTKDLPVTMAGLEKEWGGLFNDAPFDYFFLDSYFDTFYREEQQFAGVFGFFSMVGVVITCMGLFGLSSYNTGSRTKEIGIRKSLGGSPRSIMWMFSKEYLNLVLVANLISIPAGTWLLNNWLKNYPHRIEFGVDFIVVPLILIVLIAQFTVGYQTFKAAHMNPVKSLRNE